MVAEFQFAFRAESPASIAGRKKGRTYMSNILGQKGAALARRSWRFLAQGLRSKDSPKKWGTAEPAAAGLDAACPTLRAALSRKTSGARRRSAAGSKVRGLPPLRPCWLMIKQKPSELSEGSCCRFLRSHPRRIGLGRRSGRHPAAAATEYHGCFRWIPQTGTFYFAGKRNFLLCLDTSGHQLDTGSGRAIKLYTTIY